MLKTKKTSPKKIKTPQQAANEKSSKRRGTLLRKSLEIAKLCGVHVSMVIEDQEGNFYTYKTKKQQNWPPANIVAAELEDPVKPEAEKIAAENFRASSTSLSAEGQSSSPSALFYQYGAVQGFRPPVFEPSVLEPPVFEPPVFEPPSLKPCLPVGRPQRRI